MKNGVEYKNIYKATQPSDQTSQL